MYRHIIRLALTLVTVTAFVALGCNKDAQKKETTPADAPDPEEEARKKAMEEEAAKEKQALLDAIAVYRYSKEKLARGEKPPYETAWDTIVKAGDAGALELKKEIEKVAAGKKEDHAFETAASLLLWEIRGLEEAETIAEIWERIPLTLNYNGIYFAALDAAKTKDPRALPMLRTVLGTQEGLVLVFQTGLKLVWPTTHELLFGVYGEGGLPFLHETLKTTRNTVEQKSAIRILTAAGYVKALPEIRKLSELGIGAVRYEAVRALGTFGHPDDFERLVAGLSSDSNDMVTASILALLNFEDLRATEYLIPLASSEHKGVQNTAYSGLMYLLTEDTLATIQKCAKKSKDKDLKARCKAMAEQTTANMGLSLKAFNAKPKKKKQELIAKLHALKSSAYVMAEDDKHLSPEELKETLAEWKENKTVQGGTRDWVRTRHILEVATVEDIGALLDVRSTYYASLEKPSLGQVSLLNEMVKHIRRLTYRTPTGIANGVESP